MELITIVVFSVGYLLIAMEHTVKINKTAIALLTGVLCWVLFVLAGPNTSLMQSSHYLDFLNGVKNHSDITTLPLHQLHTQFVIHSLGHNLNEIAQILFFLMGAMTIVELIDAHQGFRIITNMISTKSPIKLLWVICWLTFFLSAVLDNLTTTIVMVSLIRKLISYREMRLFFAGMIILAANAGGAWSPIGDVTTTMLWIGGQITATHIMKSLFIPSVICLAVPLVYLSFNLKGALTDAHHKRHAHDHDNYNVVTSGKLMLVVGLGAILLVPIFKAFTHLPPYLGMMLGLGIVWVVSELLNPDVDESIKKQYTAAHALTRIDMPSVLFFLGILLAVGALQAMNTLHNFAAYLNQTIGDNRIIISLIGVISSIVDNVPLVAASMGMYDLKVYHTDHMIWEYLAYCTGTGGSILVIGSAAGIAAMGMEKIDFIWYLKRISLIALLGYASGAAVYLWLNP